MFDWVLNASDEVTNYLAATHGEFRKTFYRHLSIISNSSVTSKYWLKVFTFTKQSGFSDTFPSTILTKQVENKNGEIFTDQLQNLVSYEFLAGQELKTLCKVVILIKIFNNRDQPVKQILSRINFILELRKTFQTKSNGTKYSLTIKTGKKYFLTKFFSWKFC